MTVTEQTEALRAHLRQAVFDCRERGLTEAAAWAAQQLNGLPKADPAAAAAIASTSGKHCTQRAEAYDDESDIFLYAKALFDQKVSQGSLSGWCLPDEAEMPHWRARQHSVQPTL